MKLLMCEDCNSIFNLSRKWKQCECGKTGGKYLEDGINAIVSKDSISIAIGNGSFINALGEMRYIELKKSEKANREFYLNNARFIAWVRPNEGPGNPHTKV